MRPLSSSQTVAHKFVFPALWIVIFGSGTLTLLVKRSPEAPIFLSLFTIGSAVIYTLAIGLKRVSLRGDSLVISNFRREIIVPISDLERVSGSVFINPELVWLHFKHDTGFGKKIIFAPRHRWFRGFSRHPVVEELNRLRRRGIQVGA
ncbi:hypothetical protein [Lysobacter sp. HA35]